jgi:hypothetical protein
MRVFDLVGGAHGQRPGTRVAVIGSCRVYDPFEELANLGRAVRVWANASSATHSFGEAQQSVRYTRGEIDIPEKLAPFIFEPPVLPARTAAGRRILNSVDTVFVEICDLRQIWYEPYYFQANCFYTAFVSKFGAPLLPWYRVLASGTAVSDEMVATALAKLTDRSAEDRALVESVMRQTRIKSVDADLAAIALDELMFDRAKQWVLVSHFVVPGLAGTQMQDRVELIDVVGQAASRNKVTMFDPSVLLTRHGREVALASEGGDIYHYNPDFNETVAGAMLGAAGLMSAPAKPSKTAQPEMASLSASAATESVNIALLHLHRERLVLGVDESGLYPHYMGLLDSERIAGQWIAELANLIAHLLPRFDSYHVLRAGLGELAFVLAALGLRAVGFDPNPRRFAAMSAGLEKFCDNDAEMACRLTIGRSTIPDVPERNRVLGIANHLIGFAPEQQDQALSELSQYSALLIEPRIFLSSRESDEEQEAVVEAMRARGFTQIREFPKLGIVYCAKPHIVHTETASTPHAVELSVGSGKEHPALEAEPPPAGTTEQVVAPGSKERGWTLAAPFVTDGGVAWMRVLPVELQSHTDKQSAPYQSDLRFFEDGQELGPGHARHETIRNIGGGHYSCWSDRLYFSTSDGSDPNTNGRSYTLALVN